MPPPLDSRQLRAFGILARTGSFTEAARELHLTQSAVSHAIRALEEDVGCRLLDRTGKKATLTQSGEQLLQRADRILAEMELARHDQRCAVVQRHEAKLQRRVRGTNGEGPEWHGAANG